MLGGGHVLKKTRRRYVHEHLHRSFVGTGMLAEARRGAVGSSPLPPPTSRSPPRKQSTRLFFFKQKTAYEITYGDWSSDVCSSDLSNILSSSSGEPNCRK